MRRATSLLLLAGSASAAFQFPFNLWPASNPPSPIEVTYTANPQSPRVAIIGAGAGGSSAAFWIAKAKERFGIDVEVDVYDRSNYIGGRSTTVYPYDDSSYQPVELGASIFVNINKNLWRASDEFNLPRYGFEDEEGELGFWDGESFVFRQGGTKGFFGSFLDNIKVLWRYGYFSPKNTQNLVKDMTDKFVKLYAPEALKWENLTDISDAFEWDELISQTASEYFRSHGVSEKFTNEVIDAMTLVNYAQDVDSIHALEAAASIAASGAASIKGGNWQIFENFVHRSGARVFLNTNVTSISRKSPTTWTVATSQGAADYLAVILAAPYHTSDISIPEELAALIPKQPYIHLHVTLLATTAPTPNPAYFGLPAGAGVPTSVLTTLAGARKGGKAPEFNSLTYHGKLVKSEGAQKSADASESETAAKESEGASPDSGTSPLEANVEAEAEAGAETEAVPAPPAPAQDEWVVKIFSMGPMSDEWLADVFQGQVGWVLRKEWDAYPVLPPTSTFAPVKLDRGLFYVNAFEPFISTMETETLASRNVVDWLLKEEFGAGICTPPQSRAAADDATVETVETEKETETESKAEDAPAAEPQSELKLETKAEIEVEAEAAVAEPVVAVEKQLNVADFVYGWDC